ncbi:MAG: efflux RND transporter periplasmic adaptor subunit, partial [Gemmatimonadales bacterium]
MTDFHLLGRAALPLTIGLLAVLACGGAEGPASERTGGVAAITDSSAAPATDTVAIADTVVTLDSVSLRLAGVELVPVARASGGILVANGTITFDANRVAVVASRAEGRVTSVQTDLGRRVPAGAVLALLESSEVGQLRGELERARATMEIARKNYER